MFSFTFPETIADLKLQNETGSDIPVAGFELTTT